MLCCAVVPHRCGPDASAGNPNPHLTLTLRTHQAGSLLPRPVTVVVMCEQYVRSLCV